MYRQYPVLAEVPPGGRVKVMRLGGGRPLWGHMLEMGLIPGALVTVESVAPQEGMEITVKGSRFRLPLQEAAHVFVRTTG